jgi:tetratricopeptide (TPR) repeat protein
MLRVTVLCLFIAFTALADVDPDAEITTTAPDVPGEEGIVLSSEVRAQLEESASSYLQEAEENLHSPDIAGEMLFKAGECYEKLGNWTKAREIFTLYNQRYRETGVPDLVVESYYRAGCASLKLGDAETGRDLLFECTKVYEDFNAKPGVEVNFDIPAKAYIELGDMLFDDYVAITLEGDLMDLDPLVQVATRKYGMMNELTEIYGRAAGSSDLELCFSARYKAGLVYEMFYLAVNQMELSFATLDRLMEENPEEAAEIEEVAVAQLNEFQTTMDAWAKENGLERAIQVYEYIIRSAEEHGETNQWVQMAEERLEALIP